ncbi:S8 family serine peptidase [bacterium]|nr:S8 family serine peptidase [bacterium]
MTAARKAAMPALLLVAIALLVWLGIRAHRRTAPPEPAAHTGIAQPPEPEQPHAHDVPQPRDAVQPRAPHVAEAPRDVPAAQAATQDLPYVEGELILRLADRAMLARLEELLSRRGIAVLRRLPQLGIVRVKLPEGMTVPEAEEALGGIGEISETIRNVKTELPRDVSELPLLDEHRRLTLVNDGGRQLIHDTDPLAHSSAGKNVMVALLDTGVDDRHPDLVNRVLRGYNFVDDSTVTMDDHFHGTACAGIIVGELRSSDGVSGVAPAAYLLPVKVMDAEGRGNAFAVAEGIVYAADRGAKVINLSIGTHGDSVMLSDAVDYAQRRGAVIVASSGNDGREDVYYPAAYPSVVCVGAVDGEGNIAPFSNFGDAVDVVAPGVAVRTTAPGMRDALFSGTSAATPFVAGALAAIMGENPNLSPADAVKRLVESADNLGPAGWDPYSGAGLINLKRALRSDAKELNDLAVTSLYFTPGDVSPGMPVRVNFVIQNQGNRTASGATFTVEIAGEREDVRVKDLKRNECLAITRDWTPPAAMPESELRIRGIVRTSTADDELDDNGRGVILQRSTWE